MRKILGVSALLLASLLQTACGYSLVGRGSTLPPDVKKVFVAPLENLTSRSQVEQILTRAVVNELLTRRRFEVVNLEADGDAVLRGKVTSFTVRPVSFDGSGLANRFEISVLADMRFERPPQGGAVEPTVLWANARYTFREDYPLQEASANYFDRENLAIENTAESFAKTLVTDFLEGF